MRPPLPYAVLVMLVLAAACTPTAPRELAGPAPRPTPVATATAEPSPTPTPTPTPDPTPEPAAPFTVVVEQVRVATADNGALFGQAPVPSDPDAANQAAEEAAAALSRFLTAQFTDPATWFSEAGVAALVDPAILDEATRQALGTLDAAEVRAVRTGSASAIADVVIAGDVLDAVTLTYASTLDVTIEGVTGPVRHEGVVTFSPLQGSLTLAAVHPRTTFDGELAAVLG